MKIKKVFMVISLALSIGTTPVAIAQPDYVTNRIHELSIKYKVNEQLAIRIIQCESGFNPFAIHNNGWSKDFGWWQINDKSWQKYMLKRDLDITMPNENLEAGFIILSQFGSYQWRASKSCWK